MSRIGILTCSKCTKTLIVPHPPVVFGKEDLIVEGDDNEMLRSLGVQGKILHTPGHSLDSISLLLDDESCFCGDAAMNAASWLGTRYCCIYISDMEDIILAGKK